MIKLTTYEIDFKEANMIKSMVKVDAFPHKKEVKDFDLLQQLKRANLENRLDSRLKHFSKYKLLIIDELGYLPIDKEDSKLFFQLIDMGYEKKVQF